MASAPHKIVAVFLELVESALRNIGSPVGFFLRRLYYETRLKSCGTNLRIDCGVFLINPRYISLGDNVILDKRVIMIAGPAGEKARVKCVPNSNCNAARGELMIGSDCHIGVGTIVQGHGGVVIGDCFTSSSGCMIYSLSNDPYRCLSGTTGGARKDVHYVETPVGIGRNVWLGLQSIVVGSTINDDVFVKPNSVVVTPISENQIAEGQPARPIRSRFRAGPNPDRNV